MSTVDPTLPGLAQWLDLVEATKRAQGVRYAEIGGNISPPSVIVGPPGMSFEAYSLEPSSYRFLVYVVVAANDGLIPRLLDATHRVMTALDTPTAHDITIISVMPGSYYAGANELPAMEITVEIGNGS